MKISELAEAAGESIPTIKYYIREGVLPPGDAVTKTSARYDESHLRRLELVHILKNELGMSVDKIRDVIDEAQKGGEALLAAGLRGARESRHGASKSDKRSPEMRRASVLVSEMKKSLCWENHPEDATLDNVVESVATILRVMPDSGVEDSLVEYARVMKQVADKEIPDSFDPACDPWESLRYAVLGTYLFEPLILALRRVAHGRRAAEVAEKKAVTPTEKPRRRPTQRRPPPKRPTSRRRRRA